MPTNDAGRALLELDGSMTIPVIDAHQHFWRMGVQRQPWREPEHHAIARDYEPDHLAPLLEASGVDGSVLMQSVDEPAENDRLLEFLRRAPFVCGIVAWLPLSDAVHARAELARTQSALVRGVRCLVGDDPLDWLARPDTLRLFETLADRDLVWDVVPTTHEQVQAIRALSEHVPQLRIAVDHLGRPPVERAGWYPWADDMEDLASRQTIHMKVSIGIDLLSRWGGWNPESIAPYVHHVASLFGARRLMLASNWPVIELRASYGAAWSALAEQLRLSLASPASLAHAVGGTAIDAYRLDPHPTQSRSPAFRPDGMDA